MFHITCGLTCVPEPAAHLDQALLLEHLDRLADDRAAHRVALAQRRLGRQRRARRVLPADDALHQLAGQRAGQVRRASRPVRKARHGVRGRPCTRHS